MSLVDYEASSSDEDDDHVPINLHPQNIVAGCEAYQKLESSNPSQDKAATEKLPDASELLNSAGFSSSVFGGVKNHLDQSSSRKRVSIGGSAESLPRSAKVPKGTLPHSKNVPDTAARALVPPQLSGRSNVVTEDITKLFVKRQAEAAKSIAPQIGDS